MSGNILIFSLHQIAPRRRLRISLLLSNEAKTNPDCGFGYRMALNQRASRERRVLDFSSNRNTEELEMEMAPSFQAEVQG